MIEIFKALTDETRIRIINLLNRGELCVCEIESILGISQSNASRHLNKLKISGMISFQKKSQWVYYRLNEDFFKDNRLLIEYLVNKSSEIENCNSDCLKLKKYKKSNLNCDGLSAEKIKSLL